MKLENPGILSEAGLTISLTADTGSQTAILPATIGMLMRHGLSEQAAFEGITINLPKHSSLITALVLWKLEKMRILQFLTVTRSAA